MVYIQAYLKRIQFGYKHLAHYATQFKIAILIILLVHIF